MVSFNYFWSFMWIITIGVIEMKALGEMKLRLVNIVFRHGDRTPDKIGGEMYPNDPYLNDNFYPIGIGELTNNGKYREFQLGEVLRNRYKNFLGEIYTPNLIEAISSDYSRTKMSLQLVLAALFPPAPIQKWNSKLNWQPIPAMYMPKKYDNIFLTESCLSYKKEYERVSNTTEVKEKLSKFRDLYIELTKLTGAKITTPLDLFLLYHTFMAESSMNLTLPEWTKLIFPYGGLLDGAIFTYKLANYNTLLKRLGSGPLLRKIIDSTLAFINGTLPKGRKLHLYSGHETNVANTLSVLDVYTPHVPQYSSAVIIELFQQDYTYYVKVLHYLGIPSKIVELTIPGCKTLCPLGTVLKLTKNFIPNNDELACKK